MMPEPDDIFSLLFLAIQKQLNDKAPEVKWVDLDYGQLEAFEDRPPVQFPCVLVDFPNTTYDQQSLQVQWGDTSIALRIAFAPFSNTSSVTPQAVKAKGLEFLRIEGIVYKALQGWYPPSEICQPLTRVGAVTEKREDSLRVRVLTFTTAFEDSTAKPVYTKTPKPALEEEYAKTL